MEGLNEKMLKTEERFSVAAETTVTETQAVTHRLDMKRPLARRARLFSSDP